MPTILVIDDDHTLTRAVSVRLRAAGFDVQTANDAQSGLKLAATGQADLILLDIDMPRFTGLELHECLKCSERARYTPVVYLSGAESHHSHLEAFRHGAKAFLIKPYQPDELISTIRDVIATTVCPTGPANRA